MASSDQNHRNEAVQHVEEPVEEVCEGDGNSMRSTANENDSGVCSTKGKSGNLRTVSVEAKSSQYSTSTPKKLEKLPGNVSDFEILPSRMILDDPLLSSIEDPGEDLTENQINSLSSDDSCEESSNRLCVTKINKNKIQDSKTDDTLLSGTVENISGKPKVRSYSCSGIAARETVKNSLFDIPVSPKLKSRVRQRLYTLVNSIDGYPRKVNLSEDNGSTGECFRCLLNLQKNRRFDFMPRSSSDQNQTQNVNHNISKDSLNTCPHHQNYHIRDGNPPNSLENLEKSSHMNTSQCSLSSGISERFGNAMSTMLESQMRTLQLHQDELNREKLSFALQKRDEEAQSRITLYQEKLEQTIQMSEELKFRLKHYEKLNSRQQNDFQNDIKKLKERHNDEMTKAQLDSEKKVCEIESKATAAREDLTKLYERRLLEVMSATKERTVLLEKEHQAQMQELKAIISKLRAERLTSESPEPADLKAHMAKILSERNAFQQELQILKQNKNSSHDIERRLAEQREHTASLERRNIDLQEEVKAWKAKAEMRQKQFETVDAKHQSVLDTALKESHDKAEKEIARISLESKQEIERLNKSVILLQEKLSQALAENVEHHQESSRNAELRREVKKYKDATEALEKELLSLGTQLKESRSAVAQERKNLRDLQDSHAEKLAALHKHQMQQMADYQLSLEKETSRRVSQALERQAEDTRTVLVEAEGRFQDLLQGIQSHSRAQIEEYKKAVRILKSKMKKMEEELKKTEQTTYYDIL